MATAANPKTETEPRPTWGLATRVVVSALVLFHLVAVLSGPLSLPPSMLGTALRTSLSPYLEAMYLGHAYKFFAPEPGASHLVHYEIELPSGEVRKGVFPNLSEEWPRLLYHRHFMLTERVAAGPPDPPVEVLPTPGAPAAPPALNPNEPSPLSRWERELAASYANHLKAKYQARRVTLTLEQHNFPGVQQVKEGMKLDDEKLKIYRNLGTF